MESELAPRTSGARHWRVGEIRPVYFWAGRGSARFQQLKFAGARVAEREHVEGVGPDGIDRLVEAGFNWAFLSANWGFPPEIESEDWEEFGRAARTAHDRGLRVFAYVQGSNAFATGSYRDRDWYALTPEGRRIPYYSGRFMTCLHSTEWLAEVRERIDRLIDAGADGIYFDNLWMGATPWILGTAYGGFAGCFCARCRAAYRAASGSSIPRRIDPDDRRTVGYLRWRADVVTRRLREWTRHCRHGGTDTFVVANACAAVMRDAFTLFGIDYADWSEFLDAVLVEDVSLPSFRPARIGRTRLTQAAVTAKAARSVARPKPVLTVSYDRGIGLDTIPQPRPYVQALAEAAACGAIGVVKGSEYLDPQDRFTVITARDFDAFRDACGGMLEWLDVHADLYHGREPAARLALLYPYREAIERWTSWAPAFFGAATALLVGGVPYRVTDGSTSLDATRLDAGSVIVVPGREGAFEDLPLVQAARRRGAQVVHSPPDAWSAPFSSARPLPLRHARSRSWLGRWFSRAHRAYFTHPVVRWLLHRTRLVNVGMRSPYFRIPGRTREFLGSIPLPSDPRVVSATPVLAEYWWRGSERQLHLVNYGRTAATVQVRLPHDRRIRMVSPDEGTRIVSAGRFARVELDTYGVLLWDTGGDRTRIG